MATSGVIVVALTKAAERELKRQFRDASRKTVRGARIRSPAAAGRPGGFTADLRLAEPAEAKGVL